jgi:uncharacterized membrane protein
MNKLLIFTLLIFTYSCSSPSSQNNNKQTDTVTLEKIDSVIITGQFKGLLQTNFTLVSCDNLGEKYLINDKTGQLDSVFAVIDRKFGIYPPVIEVRGQLQRINETDYDGELTIDSILSAEGKNYKNTCIPYDFWCIGTEPFWNTQISKNENLINFYNPMEQKSYHFEYSDPKNDKNGIVYSAKTKTDKIQIIIKTEVCSDGMSERNYKHSAEINLNGNAFNGCAIKFGEPIQNN